MLLEAGNCISLIESIWTHFHSQYHSFIDLPLKRSRRHEKKQTAKVAIKSAVHTTVKMEPPLDINDTIEIDEEVCVVEVPVSSDISIAADASFVEMSAAEKLKSQAKVTSTPIASTSKTSKKKRNRRGSGTSSEEERWLDAIESGKLEQVDDELKKIKDPKLMTARQRAMYERSIDKEQGLPNDSLLALPTGYKEKILTAEAIQKAVLKSQKRKQLAEEKREKDKQKTMDRLLKKQETKQTKGGKNKQAVKVVVPLISYRDSVHTGATLSFPPDIEFPLKTQGPREAPKPDLCAMCSNIKRYNCSKTNVPLCSFKCYKINVESIKKTIC